MRRWVYAVLGPEAFTLKIPAAPYGYPSTTYSSETGIWEVDN